MKKLVLLSIFSIVFFSSYATIHVVRVWDGYFQFIDSSFSKDITIQLGDTVQWLPLDIPIMNHTITSTNIPSGAVSFDKKWEAPADTFFEYIPTVAGLYEYECTPHAVSHSMVGSIMVLNGTTGIIPDHLALDMLIVYPNPAKHTLFLREPANRYEIYDIKGNLHLSGNPGKEIDVSNLAKGVYFIKVWADKARVERFFKE